MRPLFVASALIFLSSNLFANIVGDGVTVYNTLIDVQTGGAEFYVGAESGTVSDPGLEIDDFLGLYDADLTADSVLMTLIGNSALDGVPLLFPGEPDPRFDTYYFFFDGHDVTDVSLAAANGELAEFAAVGIVPAGNLDFVNESLATTTDGFFVAFGPGSDYTNTSPSNPLATVSIDFETQAVPEPSALGIWMILAVASLAAQRRRRLPRSRS